MTLMCFGSLRHMTDDAIGSWGALRGGLSLGIDRTRTEVPEPVRCPSSSQGGHGARLNGS